MRGAVLGVLLVACVVRVPHASLAGEVGGVASGVKVDDATVLALQVDERQGGLVDRTGRFRAVAKGSTLVADAYCGKCLRFGSGSDNGIIVPDGGRISFEGGFTIDAWVYLEEEGKKPNVGGVLAAKMGSFWFYIQESKLNNAWMQFPKVQVVTTTITQYGEYPVDGETFHGTMSIPVNRWVHLAITYDETLKVIRTWIDGGIDRTRYVARAGRTSVLSDPGKPMEFMRGMRNVRVAAITLSRGARRIGMVPAMEAYVHQLPYEGKVMVSIDHIDRSVGLPLEIVVLWELPSGASSVAKRVTLRDHQRSDLLIEAAGWKGGLHTVTIRAFSNHRMVFSKGVRVSNPRPGGRVRINADKALSVDGKRIFPLLIYHVFPEDYPLVAKMGFNVVMPRALSLKFMGLAAGGDVRAMEDIKASLDAAQKAGVFLFVGANTVFGNVRGVPLFKDHPALLGWSGFDEPWGSLEKVQESYNILKVLDGDKPVLSTQNNASRFAETAEGADIVACDPYPLPNVSLRAVADRTKELARAVGGRKPVWTILGQFEGKRPAADELRSMAYLAIISGASGLGVYSWDDRLDMKRGWYTKDHPEDVRVLRFVVRELKGLEDVLVVPNSKRKVVVTPANAALHAVAKEVAGRLYLLMANDSRREERGTLSVEGISDGVGMRLGGGVEAERIRMSGGMMPVRLRGLGAAVYEVRRLEPTALEKSRR